MVARYGLILSLLFLTACRTASGDFCDIAKPIRLSETTINAMTGEEIDAALAHNLKGEKLCNWQP